MAVFFAEQKKLLGKRFGPLLVLLMIVLKIVFLGIEDSKTNKFFLENKSEYLAMIEKYEGKVTDATARQIEAENNQVVRAKDELQKLRTSYSKGNITDDVFETALPKIEKLVNNREVFLTVYSQYLNASINPDNRYIMFTGGWERLFSVTRFDWFFSLIIIVFSAIVFGKEYQADMRRLQISTTKGDRHLIHTKYLVLLVIILVLSLLSYVIEIVYFQTKYSLSNGAFPYQSIAMFQNSTFKLSIFQATLITFFTRFTGMWILSVMVMLISVATQSIIPALIGGLALLALPFALPIDHTSKLFLPSPYSLMIGSPILNATVSGMDTRETSSLVASLTEAHLVGIAVFWLSFMFFMLSYIRRKFAYVRFAVKKKKTLLLIIFTFMLLISACTAQTSIQEEFTSNYSNDTQYTDSSNPYVISLSPTFLIEDLSTGKVRKVIRDPFIDEEFIYNSIAAYFLQGNHLYYSIKTFDYQQIKMLDLETWDTRIIYTRYLDQEFSILNNELDQQRGQHGKSTLPFLLYDEKLFLYSDNELQMIDLKNSKETSLIKNISSGGGFAFRNGKFYYTNLIDELRVYSLLDDTDTPLLNLRASYSIFLHNDSLYFHDPNRSMDVYSLNLNTKDLKKVLSGSRTLFAVDDSYAYYANYDDNGYLYRVDLVTGDENLVAPVGTLYDVQIIEGTQFLNFYAAASPEDLSSVPYRVNKSDWTYERLDSYMELNRR